MKLVRSAVESAAVVVVVMRWRELKGEIVAKAEGEEDEEAASGSALPSVARNLATKVSNCCCCCCPCWDPGPGPGPGPLPPPNSLAEPRPKLKQAFKNPSAIVLAARALSNGGGACANTRPSVAICAASDVVLERRRRMTGSSSLRVRAGKERRVDCS